ncbi:RdRP-domain-containing protein [Lactarius akahatsu]|uniref:RNA-dependent RNA polymerase n=1 Tax=Lactarius akahatsu TaxID=416441 RepID=A0AAD4LLP2_9AGAM|nr:RdRP-domain-containing protein [Lactarius akahatsu]
MEIELKRISFDADEYDVRKAVELVLHGPDLYDPNDRENKGRKPNFLIVMGESPAGRLHNGTAILRVPYKLGSRLLRWNWESKDNNVVVCGQPLRIFNAHRKAPHEVKQTLEKARYIDPEQDKLHTQKKEYASQICLRIANIQIGVWYREPNGPQNQRRAFSTEYEREFLRHSAAYITVVYEYSHIRIDIGQRETEEDNFLIIIRFTSIKKLGIGYDEFGQPFIIFDLFAPPNFEMESFNGRAPEGVERKIKSKTRDRICTLDDAHAAIAPYAHHLRVVLADPDDLLKFEKVCHVAECEPRPVRITRVDALAKKFFAHRELYNIQRWIQSMDWKNAFQIEGYLRCGLLNTHDLLRSLLKPIEDVIRDYGDEASELLRLFSVELKMRQQQQQQQQQQEQQQPDETPIDCLARVRSKHPTIKPLRLAQGHISCHHVIITPSRILLEGPYATQSNRVIRRYQSHDPALVERFIRVEFRDEDRLQYRWDGEVDGSWFLQQRVGGILRDGFTLGGRTFEFLAFSMSALREHSVWFMAPFRDPEEGYVTAEAIRASLGDFTKLLRTPSKYAARIAQAFTATDPSVKISRDEWEEQPELGPHTDGVGTISPELAAKIWEAKCKASGNTRGDRVEPSAYQFRFLGFKGVVVVDHRLEGIKMRLRDSQHKFPVHNVEEAEFEIARAFDYPNPVHLNRPAVMALEDRGVKKEAFIDLQEDAKAKIYLSSDSLEVFAEQLRDHSMGGQYHLAFILEQLNNLGLDFKSGINKTAIGKPFFESLLRYSMNHSLREIKFKARIPVPKSFQLVGVADEGRAYINEGLKEEDVFTLPPGRIYACVQESAHEEPVFLKGHCLISRSPVIHPGDVQRVYAVGEPPKDKICFFRGLKNVVVLPAVGDRALASCLAGGDLDGDTYDIYIGNPTLLPTIQADPADESKSNVWTLEEGEPDATIDDICKFIVQYINSDVMGLLANRHITIADQSKDGVFDDRCMKLAILCSKAVDYAKNGVPVDISGGNLPKLLIKFKPDWDKKEVTGARELEYYESDRALGHMFRRITLRDPNEPIDGFPMTSLIPPLEDPISRALAPLVQSTLNTTTTTTTTALEAPGVEILEPEELYACYVREMRYICVTHTLVDAPDVRLKEEEVVLGTILATTTQPRWRSDRAYRMRLHSGALVRDIRSQIVPKAKEDAPTDEELRAGLPIAWRMWCWAQHQRDNDKEFIEAFSLIVLGVVLDCLKRLGALPE